MPACSAHTERREQASVFRHVVGGDAQRLLHFFHSAVVSFNPHAVAGRAGIATRSAIDVRDGERGSGSSEE